jgi:hypothetical protein
MSPCTAADCLQSADAVGFVVLRVLTLERPSRLIGTSPVVTFILLAARIAFPHFSVSLAIRFRNQTGCQPRLLILGNPSPDSVIGQRSTDLSVLLFDDFDGSAARRANSPLNDTSEPARAAGNIRKAIPRLGSSPPRRASFQP